MFNDTDGMRIQVAVTFTFPTGATIMMVAQHGVSRLEAEQAILTGYKKLLLKHHKLACEAQQTALEEMPEEHLIEQIRSVS